MPIVSLSAFNELDSKLIIYVDLTEPVDIFADWIDASEAASKAYNNRKASSPITPTAEPGSSRAAARTSAPVDIDEREERAPPRRRFVQEESDED